MAEVRLRRDIWALEEEQPWHPIVEAYALAVAEMQRRSRDDPTSWAYQAAVHAVGDGERSDKFRDQCQHGSWFFLPWHRMYLYWFEQIVRATIADHPDVSDEVKQTWALPYWDYGGGSSRATLPPSFREPTRDGAPNPLYVRERDPAINAGGTLPRQVVSAAKALRERVFSVAVTGGQSGGFGGPVTGWNHEPASVFGALEQTPHNDVHGMVGGRAGFMSRFDTAPLDPVFWLHHANIDRLWPVWLAQADRADPAEPKWRDLRFDFHDERAKAVQMTPAQVLDSAGDLGYGYDPPPTAPPRRKAAPEPEAVMPVGPPSDHPAELVGATEAPLTLAGTAATVALDLEPPQSPGVRATPETARRVYLNVEGITGERNPGITYAVYLNVPEAGEPARRDAHHVGNVSFFGIERVSDTTRDHTGSHGLRHAFEITELVDSLREAGAWDPAKVTVTFEPLRPTPPAGQEQVVADEAGPPVTIDRVSLYLE